MNLLKLFAKPEPVKLPTPWQLIFMQSKVNSDDYPPETSSTTYWAWPKSTWLRRRLEERDGD